MALVYLTKGNLRNLKRLMDEQVGGRIGVLQVTEETKITLEERVMTDWHLKYVSMSVKVKIELKLL